MYYAGTVLLRMYPKHFWQSSLRKINSLLQVHNRLNSVDEDNDFNDNNYIETQKPTQIRRGYIDQIM